MLNSCEVSPRNHTLQRCTFRVSKFRSWTIPINSINMQYPSAGGPSLWKFDRGMGSTLQSLNIREMSAARRAQFVEWLQLWLPWAGQQQVERGIWNECHDASKICTWGLEELINSAKQKYILTCWDVWRLGGWCDKVSGCYWPEMTVKAVFANFTATSRDICPLLLLQLQPPHPQSD